jgi:Asp-tRNA(Asn)/Glu-tRNA(Gln) amidotransferase C subunit
MITTLSAKDLRRAANLKERIEKLTGQLEDIIGSAETASAAVNRSSTAPQPTKRRKRKLSKAAKAAQAERMKKRWAKAKAAGKTSL